jgi:hypothetical protein
MYLQPLDLVMAMDDAVRGNEILQPGWAAVRKLFAALDPASWLALKRSEQDDALKVVVSDIVTRGFLISVITANARLLGE